MEIFGRTLAAQMRHMRNLAEQLVAKPYNAVKDEVVSIDTVLSVCKSTHATFSSVGELPNPRWRTN